MDLINIAGAILILVAGGIVILIGLVVGVVSLIGWLYEKLVGGED